MKITEVKNDLYKMCKTQTERNRVDKIVNILLEEDVTILDFWGNFLYIIRDIKSEKVIQSYSMIANEAKKYLGENITK